MIVQRCALDGALHRARGDGRDRGRTRADLQTDGSATRRPVRVVLTVGELFAPVLLERLVGTGRAD